MSLPDRAPQKKKSSTDEQDRIFKPLTDTEIRNAQPAEKAYRLFDGRGLYLEVAPNGGKW
jgi:hypothetical protein